MRELGCEKVSSPGPEPHPGQIPPGKTAVAVGLYFIEPSIALRQLAGQSRIHGLDEFDLCERRVSRLHRGANDGRVDVTAVCEVSNRRLVIPRVVQTTINV
jgi:hypothetical protein